MPADRIRRLNDEAPAQIRAALQPFGYYEPTIQSSLSKKNDRWVATYDIELGQPVVVTVVDVEVTGEGRNDPAVKGALAAVGIKPGAVLNHQRYEAAKQRLSRAAYASGYIDAAFPRAQMLVRPKTHVAEIHLSLDTGSRYYFGEIIIDQNILYPSFVAKLVPIKTGDPFNTDQLLALQQSLDSSGYFSQVVVDVKRDKAVDHRIPIEVHTSPRKTQDYTLGVGYGTDTGPRLSLGVELRRLNKHGNSFRSDFRVSAIEQTAAAEYQIPVQDVRTDYVALRTSLGAHEIGDWNTRQLLLGASWQKEWRGVRRRVYLTAQRERYWPLTDKKATTDLFIPGVLISRQQADDPIYPRRGYSWSVDLHAGSSAFGSDASFGRLDLVGKLVRPLGQRMRVLFRAEYGALATNDFSKMPPSQRFFAGGEGSVRGYAYQSLSPSGPKGGSLGGRYVFAASTELDVLIVGNYGAAIFVDAGNAGDDPFQDLKVGAGIGLRWRSPVGMIGLDLAHPFDDPDTTVRLHLSIGGEL